MDVSELIELRLFHEIHVSEIREWQKCEWAWDWKYKQKLYSKRVAKPLEFGTAMHAAMEVLYKPELWKHESELREALAANAFLEEIKKQKAKAVENFGRLFNDEDQIAEYASRTELGLGILKYYKEVIEPQERNFEPMFTEQSFVMPIANSDGSFMRCTCNKCIKKLEAVYDEMSEDTLAAITRKGGLPVVVEGKIDLVLKYDNGKVWVRDWKNIANFTENMEWLDLDLQLNLYLWALWCMGLDIGGFEYFEQRKSFPKPPEPLARRYRGRLFSTSKTSDYEYTTYLQVVMRDDEDAYDAGLYDEYLAWLEEEGPKFHKLTRVKKSERAMFALHEIVRNIAKKLITTDADTLVPSPTKFGCLYCDFRQPCIERMNGADYEDMIGMLFDRKEKHYYEN